MANDRRGREPQAYFITFSTHAARLPGDERGFVRRRDNSFGDPPPRSHRPDEAPFNALPKERPLVLDARQRAVVTEAIEEVIAFREWERLAIAVRTNHVHVVVMGPAAPEAMMITIKAIATRRLREAGLIPGRRHVWSRHGSTRHLWGEGAVEMACDYVINAQGAWLAGSMPKDQRMWTNEDP